MHFTSREWNSDSFEINGSSAINLAKISSYVCKTDLSAVCICVLWHSAGLGHCYGVYKTTGHLLDILYFVMITKNSSFSRPPIKYKHPTSLSSSSIHNPLWSVEKWGGECLWWLRHLLASSEVPCRRTGPAVDGTTSIWICININSAQKLLPSFISCHPPSTYWISAFIMASLFI